MRSHGYRIMTYFDTYCVTGNLSGAAVVIHPRAGGADRASAAVRPAVVIQNAIYRIALTAV